jgi:hypothetical protein
MLTELNDVYGLALDTNPDVSREPSHSTGNGLTRLICVGASHMARVSEAAAAAGSDSLYVGYPGWVAAKESLADVARKLASLGPNENDTVLIDLFSNSAFMGTDDSGLPCRAVRGTSDSRYHLVGGLQTAPRSVFEKITRDAEVVFSAASAGRVVIALPFPRYVIGKCCTDPSHLANWDKESMLAEFHRANEIAELAINANSAIENPTMLSIFEIFESADPDLSEAKTASGQSIWLNSDPVHLSNHAYLEIANMVQSLEPSEDDGPRPRKRVRLESVVPPIPGGSRGRQGRIRPPLWVSGMASRRGAGGRARARGGFRGTAGRGSWRPRGGSFRGGFRSNYGSGRPGFLRGGRGRY